MKNSKYIFSQDFTVHCQLTGHIQCTGLKKSGIPEAAYEQIKQAFLSICRGLQAPDYWGEAIKIRFIDEQRIIEFGYTPEEGKIIFD